MGAVPPLSEADWTKAFEAYQKIPEYTEIKRGMSLEEFKTIYWWEWAHRFLGRLIGAAFFVPFVAFWLAGYIPRTLLPRLIGLFLLGGLQGAVGWYMVKSGLVDRTDVSQYRLAVHFGVALLILGYALWLLFDLGREPQASRAEAPRAQVWVAGLILALIFLQLLAGALVAGLDAGMGFNTWPLINGAVVPSGLGEVSPWYLNLFENPLTVQFDHRMLGYAVVLASLGQLAWLAARGAPQPMLGSALTLALLAVLQAVIGVWTLLLAVPIPLGLCASGGRHRRVRRRALSFLDVAPRASAGAHASDGGERLIEIGDDVLDSFQADRQPHHLGTSAGLHALFVSKLTMSCRGRMDDQAARVADIGEMAEQLDVADQRDAGVIAALEPEGEHGARAFWNIPLGQCMELVVRQPRIIDPGDLVVGREPGGDRERVVAMALHA